MNGITLRQLRYLEALARHRHFGRAAAECAISQPALSMQLAQLEGLLGHRLVERHRGRILMTAAGEDAAQRAREILGAVQALGAAMRPRAKALSGRLVLGIIPSVAPYLLPRLLPRLYRAYPQLDLAVRETQTEKLLAALDDGSVDAGLLSLPADGPGLASTVLFDDPFLLAYRSDGRKARSAAEVLADTRLLLLEEGHCLRDQALQFCHRMGRDEGDALSATSLATIMQMVAQGYGATLLPRMAVDSEARRQKGVRIVPFPKPQPMRHIGLAWRESSGRERDLAALGRIIKQAMMG